jgi:membrane fusion protein (multidrug efflux system)
MAWREQPISPIVKAARFGLAALVTLVAALLAFRYWEYQVRNPTTDDASVRANVVGIAAQVSGPILRTHIVDNQSVKKGDLLFEIDPRPFVLAVEEAQAKLDQTRDDIAAQDAAVKAARAEVANREAALAYARQYLDRISPLVQNNFITQNKRDDALAQVRSAEALLRQARHNLEVAQHTLGEVGSANARVRSAETALAVARLNLEYTRVWAPVNGLVTNLNLPVGTYVQAGRQFLALIDTDSWWFSANYRETVLKRVRPGQTATITLNTYPGRPFRGVVQGVSWGIHQPDSATASLLPQVNPVVYWVRIAQRFPVRIDFVDVDPSRPLRIGASGSVMIHTDGEEEEQ